MIKSLETKTKKPYAYYELELHTKSDLVKLLEEYQKKNHENTNPVYIGRLQNNQFIIVNRDYHIWALGEQKGNKIEIMTREGDSITKNYLSEFFNSLQ